VAGDEVVDGLKRALAALQRERADIDEKIQLLQTTLDRFEDPGAGRVTEPGPTAKKKRTRKKKTAAKGTKSEQVESSASSIPEL
jgi:hypothetical protein